MMARLQTVAQLYLAKRILDLLDNYPGEKDCEHAWIMRG